MQLLFVHPNFLGSSSKPLPSGHWLHLSKPGLVICEHYPLISCYIGLRSLENYLTAVLAWTQISTHVEGSAALRRGMAQR